MIFYIAKQTRKHCLFLEYKNSLEMKKTSSIPIGVYIDGHFTSDLSLILNKWLTECDVLLYNICQDSFGTAFYHVNITIERLSHWNSKKPVESIVFLMKLTLESLVLIWCTFDVCFQNYIVPHTFSQRSCTLCELKSSKDEVHFLLVWSLYQDLRLYLEDTIPTNNLIFFYVVKLR